MGKTCEKSSVSSNVSEAGENGIINKKIKKIEAKSFSTLQIFQNTKDTELIRLRTEMYLDEVHKSFKQLNCKNPDSQNRQQEYLLEKLCEKCFNPEHDDLLLLCDACDDAYHTFCLTPQLDRVPPEDEDWICPVCTDLKNKKDQPRTNQVRQSTLNEFSIILETSNRNCKKCEEFIEEIAPQSTGRKKPSQKKSKEVCIKCHNYYHTHCFNSKKNSILCSTCELEVKNAVPKTDKTLFDFFTVKANKYINPLIQKVSKSPNESESSCSTQDSDELNSFRLSEPKITAKPTKSRKTAKKLVLKKKKTLLKLPKPSEDFKVQFKQKTLLAKALISKNIIFDDDLCFSNSECPPSANNTQLEPNLQKMDLENLAVFNSFKEMTRNGNYAPVYVIEDKIQGYIVQAAEDIPKYTLLAEYVGEVDYARNRIFDKNDSIMDLLRTTRSSTSLVICPESRGNLARFFSGINNYKNSAQSKLNVKSIRYNIEGHARVILYAGKNIKKGDILYYDYNAGGFNEYPTEDFV